MFQLPHYPAFIKHSSNYCRKLYFLLCTLNYSYMWLCLGFPGSTSGKELTCQCRRHKTSGFNPWVGMIPWRRNWQPSSVFSPGESQGQRSLEGYSPWGHTESDTTERLSMHTKSYIGDDFLSAFCFLGFLICFGKGGVQIG